MKLKMMTDFRTEKGMKSIMPEMMKSVLYNEKDHEEVKQALKVPHGIYDVEIAKMELCSSVHGEPMVTIWFKILTGEHEGSMIFYNQVITQAFQVHAVNELLRSLKTNHRIVFRNYLQYGELLTSVWLTTPTKRFSLNYRAASDIVPLSVCLN